MRWLGKKRVEKLRYTHRNPVQRVLVLKPEEWLWSSLRHYACGERGLVLNETRKAELHIRKISCPCVHRSPPVKPPLVGHPADHPKVIQSHEKYQEKEPPLGIVRMLPRAWE